MCFRGENKVQYLPIFTKLDDKPVLVVGGGDVALRKCRAFLKARAHVTLVAPEFCDELRELAEKGDVTLINDFFKEQYLDQQMLVIAATDIDSVNKDVFELANARNIFVNVVDDQPKCSFIFPSIVDRDPITIAISSAGTAPVLARRLREKLETLIPQHIGPLATLVGSFRDKVKQRFKHFADRRQFWEGVFDSSVVSKVQAGNTEAATAQLEQLLDAKPEPEGEVYVVGAGPGDPELLTLKALQLMQQADVVESLADAVADCQVVIGTSARSQRTLRWVISEPRECGVLTCQKSEKGKVALVFGRERTGLTNEELALCHQLVHIPSNPEYSSLNVAAAVQILSYECRVAYLDLQKPALQNDAISQDVKENRPVAASAPEESAPIEQNILDEEIVSAKDMEGYYAQLEKLMIETDFLNPDNQMLLTMLMMKKRIKRFLSLSSKRNLN